VASLDDEERIAMEAVALGEPLEVDHVLSLTSLRVAERLEEMGLLTAVVDAGHPARREAFRLAHPLFGEALRQRMAVTRRRRLAGRLAELVAAHGARRRDDVLRQASWLLSAGVRDFPDPLLAAARRATALGEPAVGERFGRAAHDAGGGVAALLAVGEALQIQGRAEEAEEWLARAAAAVGLAPSDQAHGAGPAATDGQSDVCTTAQVAAVRAFNLQWGLGRVEAAHDLLATAEGVLPDGDARARLAAVRAASLVFLERYDEALALAWRVMHSDEVSLPVRVLAECPAQVVWTVQCRYQRVVDSADRLEPVLDDVRDAVPLVCVMVHAIRLFALIGLGRATEAIEGCRSRMVAAVDQGCLAHAGYWAFQLGRSLLVAGRIDEARASLEEATQLLEHGAVFGHDASAHAGLGQAAAMLGDLSKARVAVGDADLRSDGRNRAWRGAIDIARCWIEAAEGRVEAARRQAADVAAHEAATGNCEREVEALDLLARLGDPRRAVLRLAEIAAQSPGPMVGAIAATAEAASRGDATGLITAGSELRDLGFVLHAADAYARAAVLLHRQGQIRRCAESTRTANELYERCGPVRTPARRSLEDVDPVATLSDRERDVCCLAAEPGVSNLAIARHLGVAERTVANHLCRAYRKLGISRRDELTAVLSAPPVA
jgi:ATP/maltotriose-dependent transcriptional regulator MalT